MAGSSFRIRKVGAVLSACLATGCGTIPHPNQGPVSASSSPEFSFLSSQLDSTSTISTVGNVRYQDFYISAQMLAASVYEGEFNCKISCTSQGIMPCNEIPVLPDVTQAYAILLKIKSGQEATPRCKSLAEYLVDRPSSHNYTVIDISYYLPVLDHKTGKIGSICKNGTAWVTKERYLDLSPGWYRLAISSSVGFYSTVRIECINKMKLHPSGWDVGNGRYTLMSSDSYQEVADRVKESIK
jgi:hypothetical protein